MSAPHIRGMAWDHPRATSPLNAISRDWSAETGASVTWDARPLVAFEDQPLSELTDTYDLILIDHPFVGFAATSGLIAPVDDWVDTAYLADQAHNSVGPSYASYTWNAQQWALAIDAACQMSATREDLWTREGLSQRPETWDDVATLAHDRRDAPAKVAVALNPNHAYCAFLSIGVTQAGDAFWPAEGGFHPEAAASALSQLHALAQDLHPISRDSDPIAISDRMGNTDDILYCALMFGYSSYARPGFRASTLRFADAPSGPAKRIGSVLGGVGVALSAASSNKDLAADLARRLVAPEVQSGAYVEHGGQPGHAAAWRSSAADALVGGFFSNTRASIEDSFIRPRVAGHRRFQELAGHCVNRFLKGPTPEVRHCLDELRELENAHLRDAERVGAP